MKQSRSVAARLFLVSLILAVVFTGNVLSGQTQRTPDTGDPLPADQWDVRFLEEDYPKSAPEIISVIRRNAPHTIDSLLTNGIRKVHRQQYRAALPWFEVIVHNVPGNLSAYYHLGICRRELGRTTVLGRGNLWRNAARQFREVLRRDSTYADTWYQYELLEASRNNFVTAIQDMDRQLTVNPANTRVRWKIYQLSARLIREKAYEKSVSWLLSQGTPRDLYFLGELYRINTRYQAADSVFHSVLAEHTDFPRVPGCLSVVRLYVQTDQPQEAETAYWQAVDAASDSLDIRFLTRDFLPIVSENEYEIIKAGIPVRQISQVFQTFWRNRDPMPAAQLNYRLIEHYRRLVYAEEHFRYQGFRLSIYTPISELQFPEWSNKNETLNDMGLIYLRYGPPDEQAVVPPDGCVGPNMSWLYHRTANRPAMIFHFTKSDYGPTGFWKLVPMFGNPAITRELVTWDNRYFDMEHFQNQIRDDRIRTVEYALRHDAQTWPRDTESLGMDYLINQFDLQTAAPLVQIAFAVPLENLSSKDVAADSLTLEAGVTIFDENMHPVDEVRRTYAIQHGRNTHLWQDLLIGEFSFPLEFGGYNIALYSRIPGGQQFESHRFHFTLPDAPRGRLACSSLELAFDITPRENADDRRREQLRIIPNPTKRFHSDEPLFAYYEIYNLSKGARGRTHYSTNFTIKGQEGRKGFLTRTLGLFGGEKNYQISLHHDHTGETPTVSDYLSFDVSRLEPGDYEMILQVTDNMAGEKTQATTDFVLE